MTDRPNAGVKRNRRPVGTKAVKRRVSLAEETEASLDAARMASGALSLSLYLELLVNQVKAEYGALPVLSPTLPGMEPRIDSAA